MRALRGEPITPANVIRTLRTRATGRRFGTIESAIMDLTKTFPRSPRAQVGGMKILPRAIDKARAQLAGTLGDYVFFNCPINRILFDALHITDDQFLDAVRRFREDDGVVRWIREDIKPDPSVIDAVNARIEIAEPQTAAQREAFDSELVAMHAEHRGITHWADLLELVEGSAKT